MNSVNWKDAFRASVRLLHPKTSWKSVIKLDFPDYTNCLEEKSWLWMSNRDRIVKIHLDGIVSEYPVQSREFRFYNGDLFFLESGSWVNYSGTGKYRKFIRLAEIHSLNSEPGTWYWNFPEDTLISPGGVRKVLTKQPNFVFRNREMYFNYSLGDWFITGPYVFVFRDNGLYCRNISLHGLPTENEFVEEEFFMINIKWWENIQHIIYHEERIYLVHLDWQRCKIWKQMFVGEE